MISSFQSAGAPAKAALGGRHAYALCIAILGLVWLLSGDFVAIWHPAPETPELKPWLAYGAGTAFLLSSFALMRRKTAVWGVWMPTLVPTLFLWRWLTRIFLLPTVAGTWSGFAEDFVPVIGALLILIDCWPARTRLLEALLPVCRTLLGLCAVSFGWVHFEALEQTAGMVPTWIPGSGTFWAQATGVAHAVGGLALIMSIRPRLAASCLAAMFLVFDLTIWLPRLFESPLDPVVWTGNMMTLSAGATMLVFCDVLRKRLRVDAETSRELLLSSA